MPAPTRGRESIPNRPLVGFGLGVGEEEGKIIFSRSICSGLIRKLGIARIGGVL